MGAVHVYVVDGDRKRERNEDASDGPCQDVHLGALLDEVPKHERADDDDANVRQAEKALAAADVERLAPTRRCGAVKHRRRV